ncbi:MAG: NAD-binding protein [Anaerolineae bacterium]
MGALLSIIINPLMFRAIPHTEQLLQRVPSLWRRLNCNRSVPMPLHHAMTDHIIVIGYGRVGQHIGHVLQQLGLSYLVVEQDAARASGFRKRHFDAVPAAP